ncbi:GH1 family beta-glucosidase [Naasia lichenicola]|uniref:Beta-glucosidase n=1 Tax=Naasia lichenicola TaxID=2565933 RepID=A0A4V3WST4_9MICO|nr:GH1 family beta-glucosidase [Naasia lichenicola]THG29377.1 beta-glucosidase [Naasia lichenicola]
MTDLATSAGPAAAPVSPPLSDPRRGAADRQWPTGFVWGAATAAAQIEGAAAEDGKSESIWDAFAREPGAIALGESPAGGVDHYHRMPEDVAIMRSLGLDSYRFSVSWPRVRPDDGAWNARGLDFYSRLVDELLSAGILPWLTLYHWDLPQSLQETGGWTNRDTAFRFRDYAEGLHAALGDRVSHWTTFNEPYCSAIIGYAGGQHAPGHRDAREGLAAMHHQHLAHGLAARSLHALGAEQVGITLNLTNAVPNDPTDAVDLDAARRLDAIWNRAFLDPLLRGAYPADFLEDVRHLDFDALVRPGDLETINAPIDFLGVNHYHDDNVSGHPLPPTAVPGLAPTDRPTSNPFPGSEHITFPRRQLPTTAMDWEIHPDGLRQLLVRLEQDYPELPPLYITENGSAWDDEVGPDGLVHDADRIHYLNDHLDAVAEAIEQGVDVRGYFVWSLLDNFEWAWGYGKRFGIVHVDYATMERTPKASALEYAEIIGRAKAAQAQA